jgi:hypothetical protein
MISLGIALNRLFAGQSGGTDAPVLRRDVLQEDEFFVLQEDGTGKLVITFGTFDSLLREDAGFLQQEDLFKLAIQSN